MNRTQGIVVGLIACVATGLAVAYFMSDKSEPAGMETESEASKVANMQEFRTETGAHCVTIFNPTGEALALSCDFKNAKELPAPPPPR